MTTFLSNREIYTAPVSGWRRRRGAGRMHDGKLNLFYRKSDSGWLVLSRIRGGATETEAWK